MHAASGKRGDVVVSGTPFRSRGEPVEDAEGSFESATPVHAGSVVEHDRDDVLGVRAKIMNEESAIPGFRLPRKQVQPVSRLIGS